MMQSASSVGIEPSSQSSCEEALLAIWQLVLGVEMIEVEDNFFELGGDSLLGMQIVNRARQQGIQISIDQLLHHQTISGLSVVAGHAAPDRAEQGLVSGPVPLTPRQHQFFEQPSATYGHTSPEVIGIQPNLKPQLLESAVKHLFAHHDALRMRFVSSTGGWQAFIAPSEEHEVFSYADLANLPSEDHQSALDEIVKRTQSCIDLSAGPLMQICQIDFGPDRRGLLALAVHHLVVDALSVPILLEDIQTGYEQLNRGEQIRLPAKSTSFKYWAEQLDAFARSPDAAQELKYWLAQPWDKALPLPVDHPDSAGSMGTVKPINVSIDADETQTLLYDVPRVCGTRTHDALLTSLVRGFASWTGSPRLLVDLRSHGRDPIFPNVDISRTVGWFTVRFPVVLDGGSQVSEIESVRSIGQHLRLIPNGGIGYGALKYSTHLKEADNTLRNLPVPDVGFNYQGRFDRMYRGLPMYIAQRDERARLQRRRGRHMVPSKRTIQVTSSVHARQVSLRFDFHQAVHEQSTVERVAQEVRQSLLSLIRECRAQ